MRYAIQWLRSFVWLVQAYFMMAVMGIVFFPWAIFSKYGARACCHSWARWAMWTSSWMVGFNTEFRGTPPTEECIVAPKHQSFLDAAAIFTQIPWGKFIMKHSLIYAPVVGQYGLRIGCVPVKRGKRAEAIKKMKEAVAAGQADPGQLIIYPQGTRIAPGVKASYKVGTGALYEQLGQPCYPVAVNVGLFWPRKGIMRYPGTAVIEFLPPIPPGLPIKEFMKRLEREVEEASERLHKEGCDVRAKHGFPFKPE